MAVDMADSALYAAELRGELARAGVTVLPARGEGGEAARVLLRHPNGYAMETELPGGEGMAPFGAVLGRSAGEMFVTMLESRGEVDADGVPVSMGSAHAE